MNQATDSHCYYIPQLHIRLQYTLSLSVPLSLILDIDLIVLKHIPWVAAAAARRRLRPPSSAWNRIAYPPS
jgi:hypothetical protein